MRNTMIYQMKSLYVGTQIFENRCGCNNTENKEKNIILYHDRVEAFMKPFLLSPNIPLNKVPRVPSDSQRNRAQPK